MKRIPLSGKRGAGLFALVDEEDYPLLSRWSWCLWRTRHSRTDYAQASVHGRVGTKLHQFIMGEPPVAGLIVDHVNGNGLDNRRTNLRWVTHLQSTWNTGARIVRGRTSKYKGVSYKRHRTRPWVVQIARGRERLYIGSFATEEEAAVAYDAAALSLRGVYARLNFPEKNLR